MDASWFAFRLLAFPTVSFIHLDIFIYFQPLFNWSFCLCIQSTICFWLKRKIVPIHILLIWLSKAHNYILEMHVLFCFVFFKWMLLFDNFLRLGMSQCSVFLHQPMQDWCSFSIVSIIRRSLTYFSLFRVEAHLFNSVLYISYGS